MLPFAIPLLHHSGLRDRKSTRLNSSHSQISYAVFCLKKTEQHSLSRLHDVEVDHPVPHVEQVPDLAVRPLRALTDADQLLARAAGPCVGLAHVRLMTR